LVQSQGWKCIASDLPKFRVVVEHWGLALQVLQEKVIQNIKCK
jgi:hypothetical protein